VTLNKIFVSMDTLHSHVIYQQKSEDTLL